jgi:hypothetical protein
MQNIPFICHRGDVLDYRNEPPKEPIWLSCITLEDFIEFQGIEYEFIEGLYWDEGVNSNIGDIIEYMYSEKSAADGRGEDGLVMVYKIIMNGSYGKNILKIRTHETIIIENDKYDLVPAGLNKMKRTNIQPGVARQEYYHKYSHIITGEKEMNQNYTMFKRYCYDDNYTMPHIGSLILGMSKRILYRVLNICNELNVLVTYIDTDSIRFDKTRVGEVEELFRNKYNCELRGNELGQFKDDMKLKYQVEVDGELGGYDKNGKFVKDLVMKAKNVSSNEELVVGKKNYLDNIEGIDHNARVINDHYKRLKGISEICLDYLANTDYRIVYIKKTPRINYFFDKMENYKLEGIDWFNIQIIDNKEELLGIYYKDFIKISKMKLDLIDLPGNRKRCEDEGVSYEICKPLKLLTNSQGLVYEPETTINITDTSKYFGLELVNPFYVSYNKKSIIPGYPGDILQVYKDMCTEDGVYVNMIVPGKTFFVYNYGKHVGTRMKYGKVARIGEKYIDIKCRCDQIKWFNKSHVSLAKVPLPCKCCKSKIPKKEDKPKECIKWGDVNEEDIGDVEIVEELYYD